MLKNPVMNGNIWGKNVMRIALCLSVGILDVCLETMCHRQHPVVSTFQHNRITWSTHHAIYPCAREHAIISNIKGSKAHKMLQ